MLYHNQHCSVGGRGGTIILLYSHMGGLIIFVKNCRGNAQSVCQSLVKCTKCEKDVRQCKQSLEKHRCGLTKCNSKVIAVFSTRDKKKRENQVVNKNPKTNQLKNRCKNCYFFYFECRQENGNNEPNFCIVPNEAGKEWISRRQYSKRILRMAVHDGTC